jgi:hypothetical protein
MKEYLLNKLEEEKEIVESILDIDNRVQGTNILYNQVYNLILNTKLCTNNLEKKYIVITDGELSTIIYMLLNYTNNIMCININHMTLGLNMWLIKKINEYGIDIILDKDTDYNQYEKYNNIMIVGFEEFVEGTADMFDNKDILKIYL